MGSFGQGVLYYDPPMNWVTRYINMLVSCPSKFSELLYLYYTGFLSFSESKITFQQLLLCWELPPNISLNKHRCVHLLFWKALVSLSVGSLPEHSLPVSHLANKEYPTTHLSKISGILWICWQDHWILFSELICSATHLPDLNTLAGHTQGLCQDPSAHKGSDPSFFSSILFPVREEKI